MTLLPNKSLLVLSYVCAATFFAYVVLVVITISFATIQTDLSASVRERESALIGLEAEYYDAISELSKIDPSALGFVTPTRVEYVTADGAPTFTSASR